MKFTATIHLAKKTATGIPVPEEVVEGLGSSRRPAVAVTFAGHTYRSTIARMGDQYLLPVSAEIRAITGVAAGDEVEVEVELDTAPREVTVPDDLAAALADDPGARAAFEALSYSRKRGLVEPIEAAKAPETRERRVAKVLTTLQAG
ncbi:MAG TPA: YdeI/OmpD-associated family protein [Acidimicrobiales bacterium]|nr:YdeI/OmpD-associated family protein [Acidimicrobiales bacterium]